MKFLFFTLCLLTINTASSSGFNDVQVSFGGAPAISTNNSSSSGSSTGNVAGPSGTTDDISDIGIIVYNSLGQQVFFTVNYNVTTGLVTITGNDGQPIPSGLYYIVITNNKSKTHRTVTVVHTNGSSNG